MKQFLAGFCALAALSLPQVAMAADLGGAEDEAPLFAESAAPAAWSWSGVYAGFDLGAGFDHSSAETVGTPAFLALAAPGIVPSTLDFDETGFSVGAQLGANWQNGSVVYGVEAELATLGIDSESSFVGAPVLGTTLNTSAGYEIGANVNLRGRIGFLATPNFLLYVRGGLALANVKTTANVTGVEAPELAWSGEEENFKAGYTLGTGAEWKISRNVSLKLNYDYYDFGSQETTAAGNAAVRGVAALDGIDYITDTDVTASTVRAGLNFTF